MAPHDGDERDGSDQAVISEALGCRLVVVRGMGVLDGASELAHLLASDLVEVFDTIVVTDHLDGMSGRVRRGPRPAAWFSCKSVTR